MRVYWLRAMVAVLMCTVVARAQGITEKRGARVFDVAASDPYSGAGISRLSVRATDGTRARPGWEFRLADELLWKHSPALIAGWFGASVRVLPDSVAGSIGQSGGFAGLRWGPMQLKAGVALSLLNVLTRDGGADGGLFSPRSMAGLGIDLGPVQIDALAHVEYLWCWFGPDYYVRGLGISLSILRPRIGLGRQGAQSP